MTNKPSSGVSPGRLALWGLIAVLLVAGVALYFRRGADVTPMAERVR